MSNWYITPSHNDILHYGVLGMKWGVRRYQNKDGSLTSKGKEHYNQDNSNILKDKVKVEKTKLTTGQKVAIGAAAVAIAAAAIGGMYVYKKENLTTGPIQEFNYGKILDVNNMSDKSKTLQKGTTIQRISSKSVEDYAGEGKRIYASYLSKDKALYKAVMPEVLESWKRRGIVSGDSNTYVHTMKLAKDLKLASDKDIAEAYLKVTGRDKVDAGQLTTFMMNVDTRNPYAKSFIDELSNRGYDGMIDQNDKGWSKEPLIIFNPNNNIENHTSHKLSNIEKFISVLKT